MAPEYNHADEDEHGECRHEIERLTSLVVRLATSCQKALAAYDAAYAQNGMATWTGADVDEMRSALRECVLDTPRLNPCPVSYPHMSAIAE